MGLCAVADIVIAESGTRFGFTETRLGILPAVISPFVVAKIGESEARALFPTGRRFDAIRAMRIGLVHEVVEGEAALDAAVDAAVADLLAAGPTAARAAKSIIREIRGLGHGSSKWHTARVIARQRTTAGGAGGLPGVRREAPAGLEARRGLTLAGSVGVPGVDRRRPICDNRDSHERRAESEPGRGADRRHDTTVQRWIATGRLPAGGSVVAGVSRLTRLTRSRELADGAPADRSARPAPDPLRVHRQPRRDRGADRADLPARSGSPPSRRPTDGPGALDLLDVDAVVARGPGVGRRRGPPGLRLPGRERGLRRGRRGAPA